MIIIHRIFEFKGLCACAGWLTACTAQSWCGSPCRARDGEAGWHKLDFKCWVTQTINKHLFGK